MSEAGVDTCPGVDVRRVVGRVPSDALLMELIYLELVRQVACYRWTPKSPSDEMAE